MPSPHFFTPTNAFFACIETGANSRQVPSVSEAPKVLLPRSVSADRRRRRGRGGGPFFFAGGISSAETSVIAFSTFAPIFFGDRGGGALERVLSLFPPHFAGDRRRRRGGALKKSSPSQSVDAKRGLIWASKKEAAEETGEDFPAVFFLPCATDEMAGGATFKKS